MIGTWRIWRFGDEGDKVLQSKLVINSDYSARVFVPDILDENHAQQVVVFSISQAGEKLCYSSHPARGRQVLSYGIIKLPTRNNKTTILKGAYTNLCAWRIAQRWFGDRRSTQIRLEFLWEFDTAISAPG